MKVLHGTDELESWQLLAREESGAQEAKVPQAPEDLTAGRVERRPVRIVDTVPGITGEEH